MKVVILGAGGFAREVQQLIRDINRYNNNRDLEIINLLGFIDEDKKNLNKTIHGTPVLGDFEWLKNADKDTKLALGIGLPRTKKKFVEKTTKINLEFATLTHPDAYIGENVEIGKGVIITAGNYITVDVVIEDYAMINLCCTIGHDTVIRRFVTLSPHCTISGFTIIEAGAELGSSVTTTPGKKIGASSLIGAGSVVAKDIPENVIAAGIPARVIKHLEE